MPAFYDAGPIQQVAINLFYGWGYNFYKAENQLRADSLLVRSKVADMLGDARKAVGDAEGVYRRALPPLSRAHPLPDPEAVRNCQILEALTARITALATRIRSLEVPENDRILQRHRNERETLSKLLFADQMLAGHAETLRRAVDHETPDWLLANQGDIGTHLDGIDAALAERKSTLIF